MAEIIKPKVYLDTSVISYLTSKLSHDLVIAVHQQTTREWWEEHRSEFELYISDLVLDEIKAGNPEEAEKRLNIVSSIPIIKVNKQSEDLANLFVSKKALPKKASDDALHLALATIHNIDCLLTWNRKHIANIKMRKKMLEICKQNGYELPIVCIPEELV